MCSMKHLKFNHLELIEKIKTIENDIAKKMRAQIE